MGGVRVVNLSAEIYERTRTIRMAPREEGLKGSGKRSMPSKIRCHLKGYEPGKRNQREGKVYGKLRKKVSCYQMVGAEKQRTPREIEKKKWLRDSITLRGSGGVGGEENRGPRRGARKVREGLSEGRHVFFSKARKPGILTETPIDQQVVQACKEGSEEKKGTSWIKFRGPPPTVAEKMLKKIVRGTA